MSFRLRLRACSERACVARVELATERRSDDVITPWAVHGVPQAIHCKPAIRRCVGRVRVRKPIRFELTRHNDVVCRIPGSSVRKAMRNGRADELRDSVDANRQQHSSTNLRSVGHVIEAHVEFTARLDSSASAGKPPDIFNRRARQGQCFHRPGPGTRKFPAACERLESDNAMPAAEDPPAGERPLHQRQGAAVLIARSSRHSRIGRGR